MSETKYLKLFKHDEPLESNESIFDIDKSLNQNWDKVDEYVEQLNTDINSLQEENTKSKEEITNIKEEQETQNANIEENENKIVELQKENIELKEENSRLEKDLNAFPTVNGSGEYVTLDTADSRFKKFKIFGKSWQETRSGKNAIIFEDVENTISGIAYSIKNGVVTLNGTATGVMNIYSKPINLLAGDYTLSKNVEGTFDKGTATSTPSILLQKKQEDGLYQTYSKCEIGASATNNFISKTLEKGTYRLRIFTATGNILNNFSWKPQLEQGAVFSGFEQGGAMPSAKFPSEIRNVGDNGNLYDKDNPNVLDTPIDSNGLGGNIKNTYKTVWIKCKSNTTYTVSKKYDATKNRFALAYTSEEPNYSQQVEGYVSNAYTNVMTITTNSTAKYLLAYVWLIGGSNTYQEMLDSIKIEKGTQATANNGHGLGSMEIIICNKNILNQDLELFQGNYDNNGNVITNSDRRIDKYIFLAKGNYILWSTINNWINVLIYDKNKKLLSVKNSNTNKEIAFTLDEDGYIRFGFNPTVESLKVFQLERNTEKTTSKEHKQQIIVFPFKKGQRLMEGDYLAEDEIHHRRKQYIVDEIKTIWNVTIEDDGLILFNFYFKGVKGVYYGATTIKCCNIFKQEQIKIYGTLKEDKSIEGIACIDDQILIRSTNVYGITSEDDLETRKTKVKTWIAENNIILECELAEEEIEPYNAEQAEAYKQIQDVRSYEGQTNIFSTNETSPIFEVTARRNLNTLFAGGDT